MLTTLQKLFDVKLTIAEWLGTAVIVNVPYLLLGVAWSAANADRLADLHGVELVLTFVGTVLCWPVLWLPTVCAA
jgi:hypothetical protein